MLTPSGRDRLLRLLAAFGGTLAFVVAATMMEPDWTRADEPPTAGASSSSSSSSSAPAGPAATTPRPSVADLLPGRSLGRLEGARESIEVRSTPDGPRYHVLGPGGTPRDGEGLTLEQLASRYPELDLRDARTDEARPPEVRPATLFMLADPDAAWDH